MNEMAGSQDAGAAGVHAIGITVALSNGVPEGIAAIQQDLVSLDRTMAAGAVGLEALIQLAERLRTLGPQGVMPIATRRNVSLPEVSPTMDSRPDVASGGVSGPAYSLPVRDAPRPRTSDRAEPALQISRSTAGPEPASPVSELSLLQDLDMARTRTAQEPGPAAPTAPRDGLSTAQISPARVLTTAANAEGTASLGRLPAMGAPLTTTPLNAVQSSELATAILPSTSITPTTIPRPTTAPMAIAPVTARGKDVSGTGQTRTLETQTQTFETQTPTFETQAPTFETMIAAARSQDSLLTGQSAPVTVPPSSHLASIASTVVPQTEAARDQDMQTDVQRPPSRSRQSPETAAEPREGLLILDGAQLGRWMMDRIARQASRPVAGTTGIDPRVSPTFPGAPASV